MKNTLRITTAALTLAALTTGAFAQNQGDWTLGVGVGGVFPKSGNGTLAGAEADIDDGYALTITGEYFIWDNVGIELLAATPFEHDIDLAGVGFAGSVKHLPPTLSVNYHFPTDTKWKPYVGLGVNYTTFFDEQSELGTLELDNSWGVAVQAGVDYAFSPQDAFRANIRWIDIDTDVTLNGAQIGTAEIDPIVLNFAYVRKF
ncbi:OmpW family outer membrane protein [Tateyamaria sp. ANG-S1]|uniref:OmpW/AlkL family protein n=1 Tax=Tateyamaria sp. ANG-S1 TaxID=1577905 RepID=UPI00068FC29D|nr:OmpW family outer membrane protein [Tateyamaria sp. ANG-S1]